MTKFITKNNGILIPAYFIENLMPQANGTFVKVYLYALHLASSNIEADNATIAKALDILESDVIQAFTYWYKAGAVAVHDGIVEFLSGPAQMQTISHAEPVSAAVSQEPKTYTVSQVTQAIQNNKSLSDMCSLAQEILGKTLSTKDIQTLFWFYDELQFPPEVILMLLEYCVSKEKRNMSYIEKVAISWHERKINTLEAVDKYIRDEHEKSGYIYSLRKVIGILDRSLSQTEEKYLYKWRDEYHMTEEMVALAYEYCIIQTTKLSFPYMDKILQRWKTQGIHTVLDAERDNNQFKKNIQPQQTTPSYNTNYQNQGGFEVYHDNFNHDELEKMVWEKLNKK